MPRRLILFAKRPRLGRVKTRLVPPLTTNESLELYEAFLADQVRFVSSFRAEGVDVELCLDGPWPSEDELRGLAVDLARTEQGPGHLGERMLRAFERAHEIGPGPTVIIGADAPSLPAERVHEAFRHLETSPGSAVVGPALDGGYVLIGMDRPRHGLFEDVPWGGPDVLATTRRRAAEAGLGLIEIEPWYDVDDDRALARLYRDLVAATVVPPGRADTTLACLQRLAEKPILGFLGAALTDVV